MQHRLRTARCCRSTIIYNIIYNSYPLCLKKLFVIPAVGACASPTKGFFCSSICGLTAYFRYMQEASMSVRYPELEICQHNIWFTRPLVFGGSIIKLCRSIIAGETRSCAAPLFLAFALFIGTHVSARRTDRFSNPPKCCNVYHVSRTDIDIF